MQHRARMRIESDHRRHGAHCARALNDGAHDQLVAQVQTVKHAEREHGRALNFRVVSSVKKTHKELRISKTSQFRISIAITQLPVRRKQTRRRAAVALSRDRV